MFRAIYAITRWSAPHTRISPRAMRARRHRRQAGAESIERRQRRMGPVAMPPNTQVSEAEAHTLVKWVLSQK
jgi:hypothetical protein